MATTPKSQSQSGSSQAVDDVIAELQAEQGKPQTHGAVGAGFDWTQLIPLLLALLEAWKNRRNPTPTP